MPLRQEIPFGGRCPKGWGLGYRLLDRDCAIVYPIPLNLLVRYAREIYFWIAFASPSWREKQEEKWMRVGYNRGRQYNQRLLDDLEERLNQAEDLVMTKLRPH